MRCLYSVLFDMNVVETVSRAFEKRRHAWPEQLRG